MSQRTKRTPRNYEGTGLTSRRLGDVLADALVQLNTHYQNQPDQILAAWPDLIGPGFAGMTHAVSFENGILTVKVRNSTLYSLLSQHDKPNILAKLRNKFPQIEIRNITFRMG